MGVNKKIKKNKEKNNQCVMHKIKIINEKNKKNKKLIIYKTKNGINR